jgi:hypothetical protein
VWPGKQENLTVYRLTPHNVTDLVNKDTGDPGGDLGFYLGRLQSLWKCKPPYNAGEKGCFLANDPVIVAFDVEFDGLYGPFLRCNPEEIPGGFVDTSNFGCFPWHGRGLTPWVQPNTTARNSCTDGAYCARVNQTVAKDWALHKVSNATVMSYFEGWWYATSEAGQCPKGRRPGDGLQPYCSWRITNPVHPGGGRKIVNSTCLADRLLEKLEDNGKSCFDKCPQPLNRLDKCYGECINTAVIGSTEDEIPPVDKDAMVAIWIKAFTAETNVEGGCPDIGSK